MPGALSFALGVKSDPIEYRYSYEWLFRLLADEGVDRLQLGTSFETYLLPDEFFHLLRRQAADAGIRITSIFTAHRELGGFFREEPGYVQVARRCYERLIEVGGILGAKSVGSNPGAVMRDRMETKPEGLACYIRHMKELMRFAAERGVDWLTIEPMSCLAEPPTLPEEMRSMAEELVDYNNRDPKRTARVGYCVDIAHGYIDENGALAQTHVELFEASLPYLYELHLKNTDARFESTFGFSPAELEKGIVRVEQFREILERNAGALPIREVTGYLEIGGPKLGRDYSDCRLEASIRQSLQYLRQAWLAPASPPAQEEHFEVAVTVSRPKPVETSPVQISPSLMCADQCNLGSEVKLLERLGVEMLHLDIMDAHFVPNMPLGLVTVEHLRSKTDVPFDVHLMVENNDFFVEKLARIGVQQISVHAESARHLDRTLTAIREHGIRAGVSLNPATPLAALDYVLELLDFVLLMTVNPGFAGQKMASSAMRKIADCRSMLDRQGLDIPIEVDGNVSFENIPSMVAAGAGQLVAGSSSLFSRSGSLTENLARMRGAIEEGLARRARTTTGERCGR
jgi:ribulose-phosphate 3-epimerase